MPLTRQALNRTLLLRQHLLARTDHSAYDMVEHLVGLQAQENLPPYLSLAARLRSFDPQDVSEALTDRTMVRLLTLRGTIHLLTSDDALMLRQWTQPCQERERRASQMTRPGLHLSPDDVRAAVARALADGPLTVKALGEAMAEHLPGVPPNALGHLARVDCALAQLPPRGQWQTSGGVVYDHVDRWVGRPLVAPDPAAIVRRYLGAFGPATAADVSAWSGLPGMAAVLASMDDLVRVPVEGARQPLYDVPGAPIATGDEHAPVRLLGTYDNVWLSHAARDRVTEPEKRKGWMGSNGGVAMSLFVGGWLEGLWRIEDGRPTVVTLFRPLTKPEQAELDEELERVAVLLAS